MWLSTEQQVLLALVQTRNKTCAGQEGSPYAILNRELPIPKTKDGTQKLVVGYCQ